MRPRIQARAVRDTVGERPGAGGADPGRDRAPRRDERITFARFMEMALTEPGLGYYVTSDERPTRAGDFLTAPELHPFFGRCIGRLLTDVWAAPGARRAVRGPGMGRGPGDAGRTRGGRPGRGWVGPGRRRIEWQPVDIPGRHPAAGRGARSTGAVIANEYLDALPVHRLVRRGDRILERYVTWVDGWFTEVEDELSDAALAAPLDAAGGDARRRAAGRGPAGGRRLAGGRRGAAGARHRAGHRLRPPGGRAVRTATAWQGTLVTYREHVAGDDPFAAIGRQDLTAHVDISALQRTADAVGPGPARIDDPGGTLAGLGLGELLYRLGRDPATQCRRLPRGARERGPAARPAAPRWLPGARPSGVAWRAIRRCPGSRPLPGPDRCTSRPSFDACRSAAGSAAASATGPSIRYSLGRPSTCPTGHASEPASARRAAALVLLFPDAAGEARWCSRSGQMDYATPAR